MHPNAKARRRLHRACEPPARRFENAPKRAVGRLAPIWECWAQGGGVRACGARGRQGIELDKPLQISRLETESTPDFIEMRSPWGAR